MKASNWLGILMSLIIVIFGLFFVGGAFYVQAIREKQFSLFLTTFSLIFASGSIVGFITMANLTPDIGIDGQNLYVRFFFSQKQTKLKDIIGIRRVLVPARKQSFVVLFAEGLTPFHRIYGRIYGHSFHPGIYVSGSISDKDELERLLRTYV